MSDYVAQSRPVVITGATTHWKALNFSHEQGWTNERLRQVIGKKGVHVKVSDDGRFEGPEAGELWPGGLDALEDIPPEILGQMQSPELVLVRPAAVDMTFNSFLDMMYDSSCDDEGATCWRPPASLYIEYLSMDSYVKELDDDIASFPFATPLTGEKRHFWFGNGRTLGKMHFDPYDNLLCPVSGSKHLTLIAPHRNEQLYEGHMREALLHYDLDSGVRCVIACARSRTVESLTVCVTR